MKQYKDELRAACLTYILALPKQIVIREIKSLAPALQVSRSRLLYIKQSCLKCYALIVPGLCFVQIQLLCLFTFAEDVGIRSQLPAISRAGIGRAGDVGGVFTC